MTLTELKKKMDDNFRCKHGCSRCWMHIDKEIATIDKRIEYWENKKEGCICDNLINELRKIRGEE